jgi:hypothetical protein
MDVALEVHDKRLDGWARATFEYDDLLTCPICHEPYFAGATSAPHATCAQGHMCCVGCFERLGATRLVSCPTCRSVSATLALGPMREGEGLYGALLSRGRMRWACGGGCGFASATLASACTHAASCARVSRSCVVCGDPVVRGELAAHAVREHAAVTARVGQNVTAATKLIVLPRACVLEVSRTSGGVVLSVARVITAPRGTTLELGLAPARGAACAVDLTELAASGSTAHARVALPARVTCVRLVAVYTLPDRALARLAGQLVAVMGAASEELSSEIAVVAVRGGGYPQRLPLLTRVSVEVPKRGGACWARLDDNRVVSGTLERVDAEGAYVRLATGLVVVPLECFGAHYTGAAF